MITVEVTLTCDGTNNHGYRDSCKADNGTAAVVKSTMTVNLEMPHKNDVKVPEDWFMDGENHAQCPKCCSTWRTW